MNRIRTLDITALNERLTELRNARDAFITEQSVEDSDAARADARIAWESENEDDAAELARLEALGDEIGTKGDLINDEGGPFVDEADWEDYAREVAEDIGAISGDESWPCSYIDWSRAADALRMDYSEVTFDGVTYLYRP